MRKGTLFALMTVITFSLYCCAIAKVEKMPVEVTNEEDTMSDIISDQDTSTGQETSASPPQPLSQGQEGKDQEEKADIHTETEDTNKDTKKDDLDNETDQDNQIVKMIVEIEGMQEEVNGLVYESELGYKMTYDIDRFTITTKEDNDLYLFKSPDPEIYPYITLNVGRIAKSSDVPAEGVGDIGSKPKVTMQELQPQPYFNDLKDVTINKYTAKHFTGYVDDLNTRIVNTYWIERDDYFYYITTSYFADGEEGWGARMMAMINTITFD